MADRPSAGGVARSTAWLLSDRLLQVALASVTWLLVARWLGPEEYGRLAYATAALALALPAALALHPVLVQRLSAAPGDRQPELAAAWSVSLRIGLVALVVPIGFALARAGEPVAMAATLVAGAALLSAGPLTGESLLIAEGRARTLSLTRSAGTVLSSATRIAVAAVGGGAVALAGVTALQAIVVALAIFYLSGGAGLLRRARGTKDRSRRASLVSEGRPLVLAGLAVAVYMSADQLMLGLMSTDQETGQYGVAVRIVEATYLLPMALMVAASPGIARAKLASDQDYRVRVQALASYVVLGALLSLGVLALVIGPLLELVLAGDYPQTPGLVLALLVAGVFVALGVAQGPWVINEGLTRFQLGRTLAGGAVNIALNLFLIPGYGAYGAAWATVVSYGVAAVASNILYAPARPYLRVQVAALNPVRTSHLVAHDLRGLRSQRTGAGNA
jgi:O-antigen/teichoic acid export membrane protein